MHAEALGGSASAAVPRDWTDTFGRAEPAACTRRLAASSLKLLSAATWCGPCWSAVAVASAAEPMMMEGELHFRRSFHMT